jgi:hypothetical protein
MIRCALSGLPCWPAGASHSPKTPQLQANRDHEASAAALARSAVRRPPPGDADPADIADPKILHANHLTPGETTCYRFQKLPAGRRVRWLVPEKARMEEEECGS